MHQVDLDRVRDNAARDVATRFEATRMLRGSVALAPLARGMLSTIMEELMKAYGPEQTFEIFTEQADRVFDQHLARVTVQSR